MSPLLPARADVADLSETTPPYDFGTTLEMDELLSAVIAKNPELAAAERTADAARAKAAASGFWPDPNFSVKFAEMPADDAMNETASMTDVELMVMQMVPAPGKNYYRRKTAEAAADAARQDYQNKRIALIKKTRDAYYDLYLLERYLEIEKRHWTLLEDYVRIAETRYAVGEGPIHDALRGQLEVSAKTEEVLALGLRRDAAAANVNRLLGRDPGISVPRAAELVLPELDQPVEDLKRTALDNNPEVSAATYALSGARAERALSKTEFIPDLTLGVGYRIRKDDPTDPAAGKDLWSFSVGLDVPVISPLKNRHELSRTKAAVEMNEAALEDTKYRVLLEVQVLYLKLEEYRIKLELCEDAILPQAEQSLVAAVAGYRAGKVDFLTLINNETMLLEKEKMYYSINVDYCKTAAALEAALGTELW